VARPSTSENQGVRDQADAARFFSCCYPTSVLPLLPLSIQNPKSKIQNPKSNIQNPKIPSSPFAFSEPFCG
jgi:hypothetical protein